MDMIIKIYADCYLIDKALVFDGTMREVWYRAYSLAREKHDNVYVEVTTEIGGVFLFDFFVNKPKASN